MRSNRNAVGAVLLAGLTAACAGSDATQWQGTVRDSAGIAIVENPAAGIWSGNDRPSVTEELRIGAAEGADELQFGNIVALDVDAAGNIYVLDQQAQEVRVFGPDGTYLREMGRPGSGPGELGQATVGLMLTPGDTVLVPDGGLSRITRYSPNGEPLESTPINMAEGIPMRWDRTPDRRIVNQVRTMPFPGAEQTEQHDWLLLRGSDGAVLDTLLELPSGQTFQFQQGGARIRLFEAEPIWALDTEGRIVYGVNSEYRLRVHTPDGTLTHIVTKPFERQPVTEADQNAFRDALREAWANAGVPPQAMDQLMQGLGFADNYPAFANLYGGPDGTIWVQHVKTAEQVAAEGGQFTAQDVGARDFDVIDSEGRFLGVIELPDRFMPLRVRDNRIYGVWRDDLDVQHVMVLSLPALRGE